MNTCTPAQIGGLSANKPNNVSINRVSNGFIVDGYGFERQIANTISEALELARKALEWNWLWRIPLRANLLSAI